MLTPVLNILNTANDGSTITLVDATGNYNVTTNPGGFGAPNPLKASISGIILGLVSLNDVTVSSPHRLTTPEQTNLLSTGQIFGFASFPGINTTRYADGVYQIKYDVLFGGTGQVGHTPSSLAFTLTNADTLLATAVGFVLTSDTSKIYYIDKTQTLTNTGGFVTEALPGTTASENYEIVYEGNLTILIDVQGDQCLTQDLGIWAMDDCKTPNFRDVEKRFFQRVALKAKFADAYLYDAHALALSLAQWCGGVKTVAGCC